MLGIVEEQLGRGEQGQVGRRRGAGRRRQLGRLVAGRAGRGKYKTEAAKLAEWLTNAQSQVAAFKLKGPLPTNLEALKNPDFQAYTNAYFSDAPTGKIFGGSVASHQAAPPRAQAPGGQGAGVRAGTAGIRGRASSDEADAWEQFVKDAATQGAF